MGAIVEEAPDRLGAHRIVALRRLRLAARKLLGRDHAGFQQRLLGDVDPLLVVVLRQIEIWPQRLAQIAEAVDGEAGGEGHDLQEAAGPALPRLMKRRLVALGVDRAEAVHAAQVVDRVHLRGDLADADHGIARHQRSQLLLAHPLRAGGTLRQHQVAHLGGRIPDPDLDMLRQLQAELLQHAARVDHRARAVRRRFVPGRRQAQHRQRIAGAQGADDQVVDLRRVLDRDDVLALGGRGNPARRSPCCRRSAGAACRPDRPRPWPPPWRRCAGRSSIS